MVWDFKDKITEQGFASSKTMMGRLGIGRDEICNCSTTHHDASMRTYISYEGSGYICD
jgi:hypothetical protein